MRDTNKVEAALTEHLDDVRRLFSAAVASGRQDPIVMIKLNRQYRPCGWSVTTMADCLREFGPHSGCHKLLETLTSAPQGHIPCLFVGHDSQFGAAVLNPNSRSGSA